MYTLPKSIPLSYAHTSSLRHRQEDDALFFPKGRHVLSYQLLNLGQIPQNFPCKIRFLNIHLMIPLLKTLFTLIKSVISDFTDNTSIHHIERLFLFSFWVVKSHFWIQA